MSPSLAAYFDRLGLASRPEGAAGLRTLQERQMGALPFENVDPLLGRVPRLDADALRRKLVERGRGGYCFELNALLRTILVELGYAPTARLARVRNGAAEGGARMHECMVVPADGRDWLVDAGFGGPGSLWPLDLSDRAPQTTPTGRYRIRDDEAAGEIVVERDENESWFALYGFDAAPVRLVDLASANFLAARWDGSPFGTHLMAARHRPGRRLSLFNRRFRDRTETRVLVDAEDLANVLEDAFDIRLDVDDIRALWRRIEAAPLDRTR